MPIHDWTSVEEGISHSFHQQWVIAISNALNGGILPNDYYAMPELRSAGYEPDVLTLERFRRPGVEPTDARSGEGDSATLTLAPPTMQPTAETDGDFYRRKQNVLVVRHASGDQMVAVIEIVSPGNKSSVRRFEDFIEKATTLLANDVHLLVLDLFPPGPRDPRGIHGAIWSELADHAYEPPVGKPLAALSYEAHHGGVRAFVRHMAVGDAVPDVSLFLKWNACVQPPLTATCDTAFAVMPQRWRDVLEPTGQTR